MDRAVPIAQLSAFIPIPGPPVVRILQLVNAIESDQLGGLQRYVGELADALAARGHEVTLACKRVAPERPREERLPSGVRVVRLDVPSRDARTYALRYPASLIIGTARLLDEHRHEVVHAHFGPQGFGCWLACRPYIYTFHAPAWAEITEERGRRYAWPAALDGVGEAALRVLERTTVKGATHRIALSRFMAGELRSLAPGSASSHLIPGGVDTDFFSPGRPASLADDRWAAHDGRILFCARRLVPRTGVHDLVSSLPQLLERLPDVRVAIAGTGFLSESIARLIAAIGLGARVRLLGRVPNEQLRDWYRRATLAVVPTSRLEGFGLSTAEALACGTAVVGTPAGATPELLAGIDRELIARDCSPEALGATIEAALARGPALTALGTRARELVQREWSWRAVAERHEPIYRAVRGRAAC